MIFIFKTATSDTLLFYSNTENNKLNGLEMNGALYSQYRSIKNALEHDSKKSNRRVDNGLEQKRMLN